MKKCVLLFVVLVGLSFSAVLGAPAPAGGNSVVATSLCNAAPGGSLQHDATRNLYKRTDKGKKVHDEGTSSNSNIVTTTEEAYNWVYRVPVGTATGFLFRGDSSQVATFIEQMEKYIRDGEFGDKKLVHVSKWTVPNDEGHQGAQVTVEPVGEQSNTDNGEEEVTAEKKELFSNTV
ncbi:hypothetical protein FA10DRAFT_304113 [Acaromyces ingoldii]|uniref:Secreted protein n=1 Tax=Acaromyces ingoldii TaxID=215250 RepID=A0A316YC34_9BASI|nr:hypothetical protein FA10DRAFT_304113 [Acaromyces ingoldii]PWN87310.1 hypothetical protein FA10DRAFT_304113 [Acaromyces ingoldii]